MVALTETQNEIARQQRALRSAGSKVVTAQDLYDSLRQGEDYHWLLIRHLLGLPYHALTDHEYLALATLLAWMEDEHLGRVFSYLADEVDSFRLNDLSHESLIDESLLILSHLHHLTRDEMLGLTNGTTQVTAWEFCPIKTSMIQVLMETVPAEGSRQNIQQRQAMLSILQRATAPTTTTDPLLSNGNIYISNLLFSVQGHRPVIDVRVHGHVAGIEARTISSQSAGHPSRLMENFERNLLGADPHLVRSWDSFGLFNRTITHTDTPAITSRYLREHLERFVEAELTFVRNPLLVNMASNVVDELIGAGLGVVAGTIGGPAAMATINTLRDANADRLALEESLRQLETASTIIQAWRESNLGNIIPLDFVIETNESGTVFMHPHAVQGLTQAHIDVINYHGHFNSSLSLSYIINNPSSVEDWWYALRITDEDGWRRINEGFNDISREGGNP